MAEAASATPQQKAQVQQAEYFTNPPFRSFSYQGKFYPSFLSPATISVRINRQGIGRIHLTVYNRTDTLQPVVFADSAFLSEQQMRRFYGALDSAAVLTMTRVPQTGTDGITVVNQIAQDKAHHTVNFWSPRKANYPREHRVVEAVLGVARHSFTTVQQQEYFERLEQYFDFGLPCRVTSTDPYEVRIYGNLSSNEEAVLTRFVQALPSDVPILVDMTNFEGMGTMFYPLFRSLLTRNHRVMWLPSVEAAKQLEEIGVAKSHLATSGEEARKALQHW
ncbi:hypothetical protein DNI29_17115 [Hymenobacter sediminis]|uniref:hypothetical protein n=1 Tax=Hymenobacter sediminis TaxID=2218621 RepID=UPI000DA66F0F|nr:hypothetical protein [Hymenobacter sediminis]RPD45869.1 hypothetical protein DNI29_17115 [Hymenobacter sediminis]